MEHDAGQLTLGELVDALTIVNLKIFMLVDKVMASPEEIESMTMDRVVELAKNGKKAQLLNMQRSKLKNAIDRMMMGIAEKDIKV
jgi:hypothetical protein